MYTLLRPMALQPPIVFVNKKKEKKDIWQGNKNVKKKKLTRAHIIYTIWINNYYIIITYI